MKSTSPLGRYSELVAAVVATGVIASAVVIRIVGAFVGGIPETPFLDNLALIAIGAVFGAAASTSVNGHSIEAAHRRLDTIAAPPAGMLQGQAMREVEVEVAAQQAAIAAQRAAEAVRNVTTET